MKKDDLPFELRSGDFIASIQNSPFTLNADELKYHSCFFGFLDILGYRDFLEINGDDAPLKIYRILKSSFDLHVSAYESVKLKILSDSILLWTSGNTAIHFWNLLNVIELLRGTFLDNHFLIRGGISTGKNFIDKDIIVSPALVTAYELEQIAKFPRILISEEALALGLRDLGKTIEGYDAINIDGYIRIVTANKVEQDGDGYHILTPFVETDSLHFCRTGRPMHQFTGDAPLTPEQNAALDAGLEEELLRIRTKIIAARPPQGTDSGIVEKHNYFANKFNIWLNRYGLRAKKFEILGSD